MDENKDNVTHNPTTTLSQNGIAPQVDYSKLNQLEAVVLATKKQNPLSSAYQIGESLVKSGICKHPHTIYGQLKRNDYLRREFAEIERHAKEQLMREDFPVARKVVRNILKTKDKHVPAAVKLNAAKLIYDKALADRQDAPGSPVSIGNIERLQVLVNADVSRITDDKQG